MPKPAQINALRLIIRPKSSNRSIIETGKKKIGTTLCKKICID
jgi:hypothetical protein